MTDYVKFVCLFLSLIRPKSHINSDRENEAGKFF